MKKFIFFSIFIFFNLIFSRILLVPEEFLNLRQATVVAQNGDTVLVNFGRPNGQPTTVSSQRIMGKEIIFEVRRGEKEWLLKMIKNANNSPTTVTDTGWTEQRMVNTPDTTADQQPNIVIDNLNCPWVIWNTGIPYDFTCTKWNGNNWDDEMGLFEDNQDEVRFKPRLTFDDQNRPWVIHHKAYGPNMELRDIFFTFWNGDTWEPERQVNLYDSTEVDFSPRIDCNNSETWCVWYGGISPYDPYDIYVSKWSQNGWEPETKISPPVGSNEYIHWFCDIAVDRYGHPHVVWGESWFTGRIYYRTYNGSEWLPPVVINNPDSIWCAGWPAPAIAIDNEDNIHVGWKGIRPDGPPGTNSEIYYSKFDRTVNRWLNQVQINRPDSSSDWYPDIVAEYPNDIWIGWNKGNSPSECHIYVAHFDGIVWSDERKLSNESISYDNWCPELTWNGEDFWAIWNAFTVGIAHTDIYYSRYLSLSVTEESPKRILIPDFTVFPNPFTKNISFFYKKDAPGHTSLTIYNLNGNLIRVLTNQYQEGGYSKIIWDGKDINLNKVPDGVYFAVFKLEERKEIMKIIKIK